MCFHVNNKVTDIPPFFGFNWSNNRASDHRKSVGLNQFFDRNTKQNILVLMDSDTCIALPLFWHRLVAPTSRSKYMTTLKMQTVIFNDLLNYLIRYCYWGSAFYRLTFHQFLFVRPCSCRGQTGHVMCPFYGSGQHFEKFNVTTFLYMYIGYFRLKNVSLRLKVKRQSKMKVIGVASDDISNYYNNSGILIHFLSWIRIYSSVVRLWNVGIVPRLFEEKRGGILFVFP